MRARISVRVRMIGKIKYTTYKLENVTTRKPSDHSNSSMHFYFEVCPYNCNFQKQLYFAFSHSKLNSTLHPEIDKYNKEKQSSDFAICDTLANIIDAALLNAESKIWHAHPVWFLNGNPIVGYSKQKAGMRLMFWSGASFEEHALNIIGKKFKDASIFYNDVSEINADDVSRWLNKAKSIQWDYKNIVKRKGKLERINLQ
jgi:hypothetical protein